MNDCVPRRFLRRTALAIAALALGFDSAAAQSPTGAGGPGLAAPGAGRNSVCVRLEAQLATLSRGNVDPARAEQIRRSEDAVSRQQGDLDKLNVQARRMGCENRGIFSLFSQQPAQCGQLNNQIEQTRATLDRSLGDLQRVQSNNLDSESQKRAVLAALGQSDCGPQYRQYANLNRSAAPSGGGGGFFDQLFGGNIVTPPPSPTIVNPDAPTGNTYRTLCVRTCDGYYFPISYSTVQAKFGDDEKVCQAMCPASEAVLYSHRNPGEDVAQSVSSAGRPYSELPNAFAYRRTFNATCSCRRPGQTWTDALKKLDDSTVERGDIVVNEERARALSQPKGQTAAPKNASPVPKAAPKGATASVPKGALPAEASAAPPPAAAPDDSDDPAKRTVRSVGPIFLPAAPR